MDRERQSKEEIEQKRRLQRERIRKRQMKLQREALWKRMRDPNLTMDDILGHSWKKELTG